MPYHIAIDARIISSSTGRYVERLIYYLEKIDKLNKYTILVRKKDRAFYKPTNKNFSIKIADYDNYSIDEQTKFLKFLNKLDADLVHFCMPQQPIFYKKPHVTTIHDLTLLKTYNSDKNWLIYKIKQNIGKFVFRKVCKTNSQIFVVSKYTARDLREFTPHCDGKMTLTYESADPLPKNIKLKKYNLDFSDYILYVGQQSDYKNIKRLGDAHQKLIKKFPNLGLVLVGKVNKAAQKNKQYFEKNNYKNIIFTDFVEDSERDWLYKNAKAYIFPSLMEGFGLPGLEAMLYETPVVSSKATCLPEVYQEAAYYFNPFDTHDIKNKIEDVLTNKKLRSKLIHNSKKLLKKYSWEKMAKQTQKEYIKAIENSKKEKIIEIK